MLVALVLLLMSACASGPQQQPSVKLPSPLTVSADAPGSALYLRGDAKGPLPGMGPSVEIEFWIRADGWLRGEFRYELPDGRAAHDVLVWTPDVALLFDRVRGGLDPLGESPGVLEAQGAEFRVEHLVWLGLGRWLAAADASWHWTQSQWRGEWAGLAMRTLDADRNERPGATELVWRDEDGKFLRLTARVVSEVSTPWGPIPTELSVDGDPLEARTVVRWDVQAIENMDDTSFDPLAEPPREPGR